jgi:hypothetical protein
VIETGLILRLPASGDQIEPQNQLVDQIPGGWRRGNQTQAIKIAAGRLLPFVA